jgi:hypothetical protein
VISASLVKEARNVADSGKFRIISLVVTLGAADGWVSSVRAWARPLSRMLKRRARMNFRMVSLFSVGWIRFAGQTCANRILISGKCIIARAGRPPFKCFSNKSMPFAHLFLCMYNLF